MDMRKTLEDFHAAYNEAFNRGDAAGCAAFFSEDVALLAPDQPMVRGRKAFEEAYQSRMDQDSGGTHTNALVEYGVEGDMAYEIGTFAVAGTNPPEKGKFVNILKRQPDGTWKVTVSIFNSDGPRGEDQADASTT
ncbi:YybH family protein [Bauldia sp.]|uniref:YybH family protein n=1 Tax=Bauldia sp. TaxID=2575872 RepID=UPI003BAB199D